jgi:hypothetical protein
MASLLDPIIHQLRTTTRSGWTRFAGCRQLERQTPKILDPITGNGFLVAPFERDEAQRLAASINAPDTRCRQPVNNK